MDFLEKLHAFIRSETHCWNISLASATEYVRGGVVEETETTDRWTELATALEDPTPEDIQVLEVAVSGTWKEHI
jgi:hypothetical protein